MPIYSFENKNTGEEFDLTMSNENREIFLKDNPDVQQVFTRINIGDPIRLGVTRPDAGFQKHVLGKIEHHHPGQGKIEKRYSIPKEI